MVTELCHITEAHCAPKSLEFEQRRIHAASTVSPLTTPFRRILTRLLLRSTITICTVSINSLVSTA